MDHLVVEIGERRVALRAAEVREVIAIASVTPVPLAPPMLTGLTQVRGQIIPVLDLMDPPRTPKSSDSLVLVEVGAARAALLVDRVLGVSAAAGEEVLDLLGIFATLKERVGEVGRGR